jgi:hypothetical protein
MYEEFAVVAEEDVQPLQPEHPITHALVVAKSRLPTPPRLRRYGETGGSVSAMFLFHLFDGTGQGRGLRRQSTERRAGQEPCSLRNWMMAPVW